MQKAQARIAADKECKPTTYTQAEIRYREGVYRMVSADVSNTFPNLYLITVKRDDRFVTIVIDDRDGVEPMGDYLWQSEKFEAVTGKELTITIKT